MGGGRGGGGGPAGRAVAGGMKDESVDVASGDAPTYFERNGLWVGFLFFLCKVFTVVHVKSRVVTTFRSLSLSVSLLLQKQPPGFSLLCASFSVVFSKSLLILC